MEKAFKNFKTVILTKVTTKMESLMDKDSIIGLMEVLTKDNLNKA